jgi:hypothetical protein
MTRSGSERFGSKEGWIGRGVLRVRKSFITKRKKKL